MEKSSRGIYKNEVDKPEQPKMHEKSPKDMGWSWEGDAAPIAYGAAGKRGSMSDERKIRAQMPDYGWE